MYKLCAQRAHRAGTAHTQRTMRAHQYKFLSEKGIPCQTHCHQMASGGMSARRATFLLTIPTSAPDLPSHGEAPQVDHIALHTYIQSTLHSKAISVNSTTATVICSVLNKQHWSHNCGCQYIHYLSAPYTHHKLRRWSAVGNTTHTLLPHPLPHLAWRPNCFGQSKPEAGHAPMVRRGGDGLASGCKTV